MKRISTTSPSIPSRHRALLAAFAMLVSTGCAGAGGRVQASRPEQLLPFTVEWAWAPGKAEDAFTQQEFRELLLKLDSQRPRYAPGSPPRYQVGVKLEHFWYAWPAGFTGYSFGVLRAEVFDRATGARICDRTVKMTQEIGKPIMGTVHAYLEPWMTAAMVELWDRVAWNPCAPPHTTWLASPPGKRMHAHFAEVVAVHTQDADFRRMLRAFELSFLGPQDVPALLAVPGPEFNLTAEQVLVEWLIAELDGATELPAPATHAALVAALVPSKENLGPRVARLLEHWLRLGQTPDGVKKRDVLRAVWKKNEAVAIGVLVADMERAIAQSAP